MNIQGYSHKSTAVLAYNATQTCTLQKHGAGSVMWVACMLGSYSYVNNSVQVDKSIFHHAQITLKAKIHWSSLQTC
jgi:hypothetical protein